MKSRATIKVAFRATTILAAAAAVATPAITGAYAADPYFKGKTITIIVGHSAGGGTDARARLAAPFYSKHIAGNPEVIVKNITGAGSMKAHNFVANRARGDGQTLYQGPWFPVRQMLGAAGVRFKYQDFKSVGAYGPVTFVAFGRKDIVPGGAKKGADIMRAPNLIFGASNPYNTFDIFGRLALDALGAKYTYVTGYRGSSKRTAAMLRNEINFGLDSATSYGAHVVPTLVDKGLALPLWSYPKPDDDGNYVRPSALPNLPSFIEVYREVHGKDPSGTNWELLKFMTSLLGQAGHLISAPPSTNAEALSALRAGISEAFKDKTFIKAAKDKLGFDLIYVPPKKVEKIMANLKNMKPEIRDNLRKHVNSAPGRAKK